MKITDEKKLGTALKQSLDIIEIEGSLSTKVIKIMATGKIACGVEIGAIAVAVVAILTAPLTAGRRYWVMSSILCNFFTF